MSAMYARAQCSWNGPDLPSIPGILRLIPCLSQGHLVTDCEPEIRCLSLPMGIPSRDEPTAWLTLPLGN